MCDMLFVLHKIEQNDEKAGEPKNTKYLDRKSKNNITIDLRRGYERKSVDKDL